MAIALTGNRNNTSYGVNSYVADDETDIMLVAQLMERHQLF